MAAKQGCNVNYFSGAGFTASLGFYNNFKLLLVAISLFVQFEFFDETNRMIPCILDAAKGSTKRTKDNKQ